MIRVQKKRISPHGVHDDSPFEGVQYRKNKTFPPKGGGKWWKLVGILEGDFQTSYTLEVSDTIIHYVIETGNIGLQSIWFSMSLHVHPKYCITCLCKPDSCVCITFHSSKCCQSCFSSKNSKSFMDASYKPRVEREKVEMICPQYSKRMLACAHKIRRTAL